ncbi:hypothetical protein FBUS_04238 [Fasciolopsis buskii]|uniref:Uncharacterized protein n=1 Tax=Fasciolopsis buskii TaxID=27845 RepID=A0A8E0VGE5_9TREM|nr:hypothetical protein FBUS_04238 [Fasciolopsis buski]
MPNPKTFPTKPVEPRIARRTRRRRHLKFRSENDRSLNRIHRRPKICLRDLISDGNRLTKSVSASPKFAPIKWNPPMKREHVYRTKNNPPCQAPLLFETVEKQACLLPNGSIGSQSRPSDLTV